MTRVDIPVQTRYERASTLVQGLLTIATAIIARKGIESLCYGLGIRLGDVATAIAHEVRRRRRVEVELAIEEEE